MTALSRELQKEVDGNPAIPPRLFDPRDHAEYVVLRADEYDRLRTLDDDRKLQDGWIKLTQRGRALLLQEL